MKKLITITMTFVLALLFITTAAQGITFEYDKLNRLTRVTYDNGTRIIYKYDGAGNRITLCKVDFDSGTNFVEDADLENNLSIHHKSGTDSGKTEAEPEKKEQSKDIAHQ